MQFVWQLENHVTIFPGIEKNGTEINLFDFFSAAAKGSTDDKDIDIVRLAA